MAKILHISDLHFGRFTAPEQLDALLALVPEVAPDAVAVSGDLTTNGARSEFAAAGDYLTRLERHAPLICVPGNHDVRWRGAAAFSAVLLRGKAREHKYSRYTEHVSTNVSPSLQLRDVVIAGCNTSHGVSRGSLSRRHFENPWDMGHNPWVIGHVKPQDVSGVRAVFRAATPGAAKIVMIHHNPLRGAVSGRHGLANAYRALSALSEAGAEMVLCGHDHVGEIHAPQKSTAGLVVCTAGTVSTSLYPGNPASFNLVELGKSSVRVAIYTWQDGVGQFCPERQCSFPRP